MPKRSEAGRKDMANRWQKRDAPADDLCIDNDNDNTLAEEDNQASSATAEDHSALLAVDERTIKKELPKLYATLSLDAYNPWCGQCQQTRTHYILVHSAIEYFIRK